jgi:hypothetical protein
MLLALAFAVSGGAAERAASEQARAARASAMEGAPDGAATLAAAQGVAAPPPAPAAQTGSPPAPLAAAANEATADSSPPDPGATEQVPMAQSAGVRALALDADAIRNALERAAVLAPLAAGFTPFTDADADAALRRGGRSRAGISVWTFQPSAFVWSPRAGRELWVLSGRSGSRALIAVLEPGSGDEDAHVASLVLQEPDATVAIGYNEQYRDQLVWSSCYGCAGEGGTIRSHEDGRIEFTYR